MRRVLFDLTVYQSGTTFHGGGEYSYTILEELIQTKTASEQIDVFITAKGRTDDAILSKCIANGMNILTCANAKELSQAITDGNYDVLYSALPSPLHFKGLKLDPKVLMIITLHGLRKLELREGGMYKYFSTFRKSKRDALELVKRVLFPRKYRLFLKSEYDYLLSITENYIAITDSYHSYCNILRYYPEITKQRLHMCLCPAKIATMIDDTEYEKSILESYGVESKRFGLVISANRYEKNPIRSIQAWDAVYSDCSELIPNTFKTIVLGEANPLKYAKYFVNKNRFVFKGYVADSELEVLYKHAHLLVFASLNEGFGYPPMEAMKYGTLVAASVNTSIPESCGDACFMFNPLIVSEITNRIMQSFVPSLQVAKSQLIPKQVEKIHAQQMTALQEIVKIILNE